MGNRFFSCLPPIQFQASRSLSAFCPAPGGGAVGLIFQSLRTCLGHSSKLMGSCPLHVCVHRPCQAHSLLHCWMWGEWREVSQCPSDGFCNTPCAEISLWCSQVRGSIDKARSFLLVRLLLNRSVLVRDSQIGFGY